MNNIRRGLQQYLGVRASLGYKLEHERTALAKFLSFLDAEGASHITSDLALRWATQSVGVQPWTWSWRLGMVRRFAAWFSALDSRTEIPAQGLLPHRFQRQTSPYSSPHHKYRPSYDWWQGLWRKSNPAILDCRSTCSSRNTLIKIASRRGRGCGTGWFRRRGGPGSFRSPRDRPSCAIP